MSMRRSRRLRSQRLRSLGPEIDPLKLSMDWTPEDLEKPQILVDDVWGDALPGSYHLLRLSGMVCRGVYSNGGKPANFHITDMCDGIAQGTEGMDYSLLSREVICDMIEVHWRTQPLDGMVLLSSCDKGVPAQLKAMARMYDSPAIHVPGGTMMEGPDMFTLERVGTIYSEFRRNELSREDFQFLQRNACPTVGCCSFMGTANTMQVMSEALASSPELHDTTALVTDGRFSGASRGPCVGYVSPEAMEGGPIAIVEKDDLIEIDIPGRGLNLVGVKGKREDNEIMEAIIRERLAKWKKPPEKYGGVLGLYTRLATSAMDGGYMDYGQCQVR